MEASELNKILGQHRLWVNSNTEQGSRANLTHANLRDANLTGADLQDSNLRGAYLLGAILRGANLRGAYLMGANLKDADLGDANLTGANLQDSNLRGAYLTGANLSGANLSGADLTHTNLARASLHGADLTGANLSGAYLSGLSIGNAKIRRTIGLPDISWIIPGCLVQLNELKNKIWLSKNYLNFIQDSIGMVIQNNPEENTFDLLVEDKFIRGIPDWVKYSGLKKISPETVSQRTEYQV